MKPEEAAKAAEEAASAAGKQIVGYVRLQLLVRTPEPEPIARKGISFDGEWKERLNGGNIIGNTYWYENPQYLLTVGSPTTVTVSLRQPAEKNEQATLYVLRYDDAVYRGRRKPAFHLDDIVKIEGDFLSPVFGANVEQAYKLEQGTYCVIPCTSQKALDETGTGRYVGQFVISANATPLERITFSPLPVEQDGAWKELRCRGAWTEESAGGADVSATAWAKNPQFLLTLSAKTDACFVLNQRTAAKSVGIYVMHVDDAAHRAMAYKNEVCATPRCAFACSVGVPATGLAAGTYCIVPCTYEAHQLGDFELVVYSTDATARLEPFVRDWAHKRVVKGRWSGASAGGSPNHDTFCNNPQFLLSLNPKGDGERAFVLQLVQHRMKGSTVDVAPVGIVCLQHPAAQSAAAAAELPRIKGSDVRQEAVVCQTEGWTALRAVGCTGQVPGGSKAHLVVIPSTFNPGMFHKFSLCVYSDSEVMFAPLGEDDESDDD
jgi:hypothetical protein